jgi:hypothetical protein
MKTTINLKNILALLYEGLVSITVSFFAAKTTVTQQGVSVERPVWGLVVFSIMCFLVFHMHNKAFRLKFWFRLLSVKDVLFAERFELIKPLFSKSETEGKVKWYERNTF